VSGVTQSNPVETGIASLTQQWIEFCWQPKPARQISLFSDAASPMLVGVNPTDLPQDLRDKPLLLPDRSILNQSEFIRPLPKSVVEQYEELWKEMRLSKTAPT
jgi:putative spermidine/putrescine transport system substrate-binding protein